MSEQGGETSTARVSGRVGGFHQRQLTAGVFTVRFTQFSRFSIVRMFMRHSCSLYTWCTRGVKPFFFEYKPQDEASACAAACRRTRRQRAGRVTERGVGSAFQALTDARSNSPLTALMRLCTGAARRRKKVKTERRAQPSTGYKRMQGGHSSGGGVDNPYDTPHTSAACKRCRPL